MYFFVSVLQEELKNIFDNESKWWKMLFSILVSFFCQARLLNSVFFNFKVYYVLLKHNWLNMYVILCGPNRICHYLLQCSNLASI